MFSCRALGLLSSVVWSGNSFDMRSSCFVLFLVCFVIFLSSLSVVVVHVWVSGAYGRSGSWEGFAGVVLSLSEGQFAYSSTLNNSPRLFTSLYTVAGVSLFSLAPSFDWSSHLGRGIFLGWIVGNVLKPNLGSVSQSLVLDLSLPYDLYVWLTVLADVFQRRSIAFFWEKDCALENDMFLYPQREARSIRLLGNLESARSSQGA